MAETALEVVSKETFLQEFDRYNQGVRREARDMLAQRWPRVKSFFNGEGQLARLARDTRLARVKSQVEFDQKLLTIYQEVQLDMARHLATQAVTVNGARLNREMNELLANELMRLETSLDSIRVEFGTRVEGLLGQAKKIKQKTIRARIDEDMLEGFLRGMELTRTLSAKWIKDIERSVERFSED